MVVVLLFPMVASAQETVAAEDVFSAVPLTGDTMTRDGEPMDAPATVRFWNYRDAVDEPYCVDLPAATTVVLFSETFTTDATTSYIELVLTGQFTLLSGVNMDEGIYFQVQLAQEGMPVAFFPGAGDDVSTLMAMRDDAGNGQQMFGGYRGIIVAEPNLLTTIIVKAYASQKDGLACYQNMSVRYD